MPVTLTDVNNGTTAGDGTGEDAFDAFAKINTNNTTLETAVVDKNDSETIIGEWTFSHVNGILTNVITERTAAAGVTVDGVLLKDGLVDGRDVSVDGGALDTHVALTNAHLDWTAASANLSTSGTIGGSNLSGSNTGDQTSMSGISDTKANFNTACSNGTFLYVGDAGGLVATHKTANYTAVAGDFVTINSAGTARTITLPATIAAGDRIAIHHFNTSATVVVVTVARNGKTIRYQGTSTGDDVTLADGETIELVATDTTNWEIV